MVHWLDRKSRMKREFHVRFCERLEGWFLWSTRQFTQTNHHSHRPFMATLCVYVYDSFEEWVLIWVYLEQN